MANIKEIKEFRAVNDAQNRFCSLLRYLNDWFGTLIWDSDVITAYNCNLNPEISLRYEITDILEYRNRYTAHVEY